MVSKWTLAVASLLYLDSDWDDDDDWDLDDSCEHENGTQMVDGGGHFQSPPPRDDWVSRDGRHLGRCGPPHSVRRHVVVVGAAPALQSVVGGSCDAP